MTLRLTGSPEHALLAMIAQEAGNVLHDGRGYLGRTALQKIVYLLQVCGVPARYRFDIHYYGPYCSTVTRDIDWLLADQVIQDRSSNPERYSNYRCGPSANELLSRHPDIEPHRQIVRSIVQTMLPLTADRMELVTTLDFAFRQLRAGRQTPPARDAVLDRFREFKGDKFNPAKVSEAYDRLAATGVFA